MVKWLSAGWAAFVSRPWPLMCQALVLAASTYVVNFASGKEGQAQTLIFVMTIGALFAYGGFYQGLLAVKSEPSGPWAYLRPLEVGAPLIFTTVIVAVASGLASLLLIVPGVFLLARFGFAPLVILDSKSSMFTSLRSSWVLTRRYSGASMSLTVLWLVALVPEIPFSWLLDEATKRVPSTTIISNPLLAAGAVVLMLWTTFFVGPVLWATTGAAYAEMQNKCNE